MRSTKGREPLNKTTENSEEDKTRKNALVEKKHLVACTGTDTQ